MYQGVERGWQHDMDEEAVVYLPDHAMYVLATCFGSCGVTFARLALGARHLSPDTIDNFRAKHAANYREYVLKSEAESKARSGGVFCPPPPPC